MATQPQNSALKQGLDWENRQECEWKQEMRNKLILDLPVLFLFCFFFFTAFTSWLYCRISLSFRCKFFSLTETPEDYTIIVDAEGFKGGPLLASASLQSPWQPIRLCNLWFPPAPMFEHTLSLWFVVGWLSESMSLHTLFQGDLP